jgi:hypothetical protein
MKFRVLTVTAFTAVLGISSAGSSTWASAGEAVVLPSAPGSPKSVVLKSADWEKRDSAESQALVAIAGQPAITATNWGLAQATDPAAISGQELATDNSLKQLPSEPLQPATTKIQVIDHYEVVPAHLVPEEKAPVYKEIEVEAGSASVR